MRQGVALVVLMLASPGLAQNPLVQGTEGQSAIQSNPSLANSSRDYKVTLPPAWEPYVSTGVFRTVGEAFYSPIEAFGICPQIRIQWSLENRTSEPLCLEVNYRSLNPKGPGGTGYGVRYVLQPQEKRAIYSAVPVFSAIVPVRLQVYLVELRPVRN